MNSKQGATQSGMHPTELQPQRDMIRDSKGYSNTLGKGNTSSIESGYFGDQQQQ